MSKKNKVKGIERSSKGLEWLENSPRGLEEIQRGFKISRNSENLRWFIFVDFC
jgi:hypothetical protein